MAAGRSKIPVAVGIVGPGLIGSTLIKQLSAQVHLRFVCQNTYVYYSCHKRLSAYRFKTTWRCLLAGARIAEQPVY